MRKASGWHQDGVREPEDCQIASGTLKCVRIASGWRLNGVWMRRDGVKQASEVCQVVGVGVQSASRRVRVRQEGVRVALKRLQEYFWRQDGARMTANDAGPESNDEKEGQHHPVGVYSIGI